MELSNAITAISVFKLYFFAIIKRESMSIRMTENIYRILEITKSKSVVLNEYIKNDEINKRKHSQNTLSVLASINFFLKFIANKIKKGIKEKPQIRYSEISAVSIIKP